MFWSFLEFKAIYLFGKMNLYVCLSDMRSIYHGGIKCSIPP